MACCRATSGSSRSTSSAAARHPGLPEATTREETRGPRSRRGKLLGRASMLRRWPWRLPSSAPAGVACRSTNSSCLPQPNSSSCGPPLPRRMKAQRRRRRSRRLQNAGPWHRWGSDPRRGPWTIRRRRPRGSARSRSSWRSPERTWPPRWTKIIRLPWRPHRRAWVQNRILQGPTTRWHPWPSLPRALLSSSPLRPPSVRTRRLTLVCSRRLLMLPSRALNGPLGQLSRQSPIGIPTISTRSGAKR
mmetsp:Transcript_174446/g.553723  ORF Transcript_174446/g.553723 Transcript_174446/m.553723 type:complete len:246 (-) Transcript_174446:646-1383(-)